jgi:hypothetical protein
MTTEISTANLHHFNVDPDPASYLNADPDPAPHQNDANPRALAYRVQIL